MGYSFNKNRKNFLLLIILPLLFIFLSALVIFCTAENNVGFTETVTEPVEPVAAVLTYKKSATVDAYIVTGIDIFDNDESKPLKLVIPATYDEKPVIAIQDQAFLTSSYRQYKIVSVDFSAATNLTEIGSKAFFDNLSNYYMTGSLVLPVNLKTIGESAFRFNKNMTGSLVLNANLETIGEYAFAGCKGFTGDLNIPASVKTIGKRAFESLRGLNGNLTFSEGALETIGEYAFSSLDSLNCPITIPASVKSMGESIFWACDNLKNTLTLAEGLTSIGKRSFALTEFTGSLTIPASVKSIGEGAFQRSTFTGSLTIPASVKSIGEEAFASMSKLTGALTISEGVETIGKNAFSYSSVTGSITIPRGVKTVGEHAFSGLANLDGSITISENVGTIGKYAFSYCRGLKGSIIIKENVEIIDDYAFQECNGLMGTLTIGDGLKSIGNGAFLNCSGLTGSVTIPGSVETIGNGAFSKCTGLTGELIISEGVKTISGYAFKASNFTGSLTIPKSVTSIGASAFESCLNFNGALTILNDDKNLTIGQQAFSFNTNLKTIYLPNNPSAIYGAGVFAGCVAPIVVPKELYSTYTSESHNLYPIKTYITYETTVNFEADGGTITGDATQTKLFGYKINYEKDGLTKIWAQNNSYALPAVEKINYEMKGWQDSLNNTITTQTVVKANDVFKAKFIFNGYSVNFNGNGSTSGTMEKQQIVCGSETSLSKNLFKKDSYVFSSWNTKADGTGTAYYDENIVKDLGSIEQQITLHAIWEKYDAAVLTYSLNGEVYSVTGVDLTEENNVKNIFNLKIVIPATYKGKPITSIFNSAFINSDTYEIISLDLKNATNLTKIGDKAFDRRSKIKGSLIIPDSVTEIGNSAFILCDGFDGELVLSKNLLTIGNDAFYGCDNIIKLNIPSGVKTIGEDAFATCNGFEGALKIPDSVISIGEGAFRSCTGLQSIYLPNNETITYGSDVFKNMPFSQIIAPNKEKYEKYRANHKLSLYRDILSYEADIIFKANGGKFNKTDDFITQKKLINFEFFYEKNTATGVWTRNSKYEFTTPEKFGFYSVDYDDEDGRWTSENAKVRDSVYYANWELAKPTITKSVSFDGNFNNEFVKIYVEAEHDLEGVTLTYKWYKGTASGNVLSTDSFLILKNVAESGKYYCRVTATLGSDNSFIDELLNFKMDKGDYDLSGVVFKDTFIYDKTEKLLSVSGTLPEGVTVTYLDNGLTEVGTKTVTAVFSGNTDNYNAIPNKTVILSITPKELDLTWTKPLDLTYNGQSKTMQASVGGVISGDVCDITYGLTSGKDNINAGTFTYSILSVSNPNYKIKEGAEISEEIIIAPKTITEEMVGEIGSVVYNGEAHTPSVIVSDGDLMKQTDYDIVYTKNTNAGEAVVTINAKGNYTGTIIINFTIEKANRNISGVTFENGSFIENGSAQSLKISGALPSGVTVEYVGNDKILPGVYAVTAKFIDSQTSNYNPINDLTATLTIKVKLVEREDGGIIIDSGEVGIDPDAVVEVIRTDEVPEANFKKEEKAVGTYEITMKKAGVSVQPDGTLTIRLLIGSDYRSKHLIKVYHVENGVVTDMNAVRDGDYMVFTTDHLSTFSMTAEKESSLLALWLVLGGCLILALAAIAFLLIKKRKAAAAASEVVFDELINGISEPSATETFLLPNLVDLPIEPTEPTELLEQIEPNENIEPTELLETNEAINSLEPSLQKEQETALTGEEETKFDEVKLEESAKTERVETIDKAIEEEEEPEIFKGVEAFSGLAILARYNKSYTAKLIQLPEEMKKYYSSLKNAFFSFKKVKTSITWGYESINFGKQKLAKFNVYGKSLYLYLALNPDDLAGTKYKVKRTESKKYEATPCVYKIKNDKRAKYALELILKTANNFALEVGDAQSVDYAAQIPYESTESLVGRELMKELITKEDYDAYLKRKSDMNIADKKRGFISAQEVAAIISDEVAIALIEQKKESSGEDKQTKLEKRVKGIVNIDSISDAFNSNETVNIQSLQEKNLIEKGVNYCKILARGSLNKPLIVEANEFSIEAVKMILLTGGKVIKIKN